MIRIHMCCHFYANYGGKPFGHGFAKLVELPVLPPVGSEIVLPLIPHVLFDDELFRVDSYEFDTVVNEIRCYLKRDDDDAPYLLDGSRAELIELVQAAGWLAKLDNGSYATMTEADVAHQEACDLRQRAQPAKTYDYDIWFKDDVRDPEVFAKYQRDLEAFRKAAQDCPSGPGSRAAAYRLRHAEYEMQKLLELRATNPQT